MDEEYSNMYKECLRNHAASLGSYATDGCGEFTPDEFDTSAAALNCVACGCHRNFHRKVTASGRGHEMAEYRGGGVRQVEVAYSPDQSSSKKRFRTKFTEEQKEKMLVFAEKLGWKMVRRDTEDEIERFCRGVGIGRKVFKIWMHNHKNSFVHSVASNGNTSSVVTDDQ